MSYYARASAPPLVVMAVPAILVGIVLYYRRCKKGHLPSTGPTWQEHFLNAEEASRSSSCSEAVQNGDSVLVLHTLATADECECLRAEASQVAATQSTLHSTDPSREWWSVPEAPGRMRLPIDKAFDAPSRSLCDGLLVRALGRLHATFPALVVDVFGDAVLDDEHPSGGGSRSRALCKTLT